MKYFILPALCLLLLASSACQPRETVSYQALVAELTNLNAIALLDMPATQIINSHDRTGANEDYNHFQGMTQDGQCILADINGPGVMNRFWFTGIQTDKKIRFYFDGEKAPRLEFSWDELRAGVPPFDIEPISIDEQNCWYSFVPVPFKKRLLITTDDAGYQYGRSPKMYYQINWRELPEGRSVKSMTVPMAPADRLQLETVARIWETFDFGPVPPLGNEISLQAGASVDLWNGRGPATIEAFALELGNADADLLRNILLRVYWDGNEQPSVAVPLGDFFGSVGQRWRAESMYFGTRGDTFLCRFPMPFVESARFVIENQSTRAVSLKFGLETDRHIDGGYFHAAWRNSGADETGSPHTVLQTTGPGRYAGCVLSVVSADRSYWVLESDESMLVDSVKKWQGTGLEDYFNSGWYYGNVFARPLHGLPAKAPFRSVQYRLHPTEPVVFDDSFELEFERGPDHASKAAYESTAFYYLALPQAADSGLENRVAPQSSEQQYTIMTELWNSERIGDLQSQIELIDAYNAAFEMPWKHVLELRKQVCRYETKQISKQGFLDALSGINTEHAQALLQMYSENDAALVQLYSNMESELYLDGKLILRGGDPQQPSFSMVELQKGTHVLAVASGWQEYPKWTQVAVRNATGFLLGTSGDWKQALNPAGSWAELEYDDSSWRTDFKGYDARVKGPPEAPYIFVKPDPFVNTLSQASGLRPSEPWASKKGRVVYRKVFEIP